MKKNISLLLILFLLVSCTSAESDIETTNTSISSSENTTTSTTTTIFVQPSEERAKEIDIDRSPRRGVIRKSTNRYISTIYKFRK